MQKTSTSDTITRKSDHKYQMNNMPLASIIIPTYNSERTLETCLKSIKNQTYPNIEIIIVDNCSTDKTVEIAKKYNAKIFLLKALRSPARNYGAKKAKGEYLLFIDSDMELTPYVVEQCIKKALTKNIDAIMIPEIRVGEGYWAKCRALERILYIGNPLIEAVRFIRKEIFQKVGGYDPELEAGEDYDLHARIEKAGCKIGRVKALIKHHEGKITLKRIVMKRYYYGKTIMRYIKKHTKRAMIQFAPIRPDYIRNWTILVRYPHYSTGLFFMKTIEYLVTAISLSIRV